MACREEGCSLVDGRDVNNTGVVGGEDWVLVVLVLECKSFESSIVAASVSSSISILLADDAAEVAVDSMRDDNEVKVEEEGRAWRCKRR
jgi:hypothetical protein